MPEVSLANTLDPAYNLGRLLSVLASLQNRSLQVGSTAKRRVNAGIIERYYGRASSAPALVFPMLLDLSRHHLSKLKKGSEKDERAAFGIENRMCEILIKMKPPIEGSPPEFPKLLSLELQGRFALGFYQQKAYDREQWLLYKATHGKEGDDIAEVDDVLETEDVKKDDDQD